ncbi:MAG: hypothetical protein WCW27_05635 [Patescibacteria group bacterium]|jgi:hypothetical protein
MQLKRLWGLIPLSLLMVGVQECPTTTTPPEYERTIINYDHVALNFDPSGTITVDADVTVADGDQGVAVDVGDFVPTYSTTTFHQDGAYEIYDVPTGGEQTFHLSGNTTLQNSWQGVSYMVHPDYGYSSVQSIIWPYNGVNVGPYQNDSFSRPDGMVKFTWGGIYGLENMFGGQTPIILRGDTEGPGGSAYTAFALAASPDYDLYEVGTSNGGVLLRSYYFKSDPEQPGKVAYLNRYTLSMMNWLEKNFGPYPQTKYTSASVLLGTGGGMEGPVVMYDNLNSGDASWYGGDHEPPHAFIGTSVRTGDPIYQAFNEGTVVSLQTAHLNEDGSPADFKTVTDFLCDMIPYAATYERNFVPWPAGQEGMYALDEMTRGSTYYKTGFISWMLQEERGYSGYVKGVDLFIQRHRDNTFTDEEFIRDMTDGYEGAVSYDEIYTRYAELQNPNSVYPAGYETYCPDAAKTWKTRDENYWKMHGITYRLHPGMPAWGEYVN